MPKSWSSTVYRTSSPEHSRFGELTETGLIPNSTTVSFTSKRTRVDKTAYCLWEWRRSHCFGKPSSAVVDTEVCDVSKHSQRFFQFPHNEAQTASPESHALPHKRTRYPSGELLLLSSDPSLLFLTSVPSDASHISTILKTPHIPQGCLAALSRPNQRSLAASGFSTF